MNSRLVLGLCLGLLALPPARGDDEAQIKAVLDKAFQAHGGKDKLVRLKSHACTMQGKVQHSGQEVQFKGRWQTQAPDRLRIDVHVPFMGIEFKYAQVFHGAQSWNALNDNVLDLSKPARAEGLEQAWAYNLARLTPLVEPGVRLHYLARAPWTRKPPWVWPCAARAPRGEAVLRSENGPAAQDRNQEPRPLRPGAGVPAGDVLQRLSQSRWRPGRTQGPHAT